MVNSRNLYFCVLVLSVLAASGSVSARIFSQSAKADRPEALPSFTGGQTLVDGSTIRMPGTKITANDGVDMELNPRPVDVPVTRPIGESYTGRDSQLDVAVRELLKQIGNRDTVRPAGSRER